VSTGIYVNGSLSEGARSILAKYELHENPPDAAAASRCEVLMAWPTRAGRELLGRMKRLRMVQTLSAGVDGLDFGAVPDGVLVFSNAGAYTEPVAEHAWGLLLGVAKGLHARNQRTVPRLLKGGTLLVVGCGAIGSEIARLGRSFGMRTVGVSRSFRTPEAFDERHGVEDLGSVIGAADAVAIALPLTRSTAGLVGYDVLRKAKESVTVANIGRGGTVSEEGLIRWLRERPESRYATDVFWKRQGKETFDTDAWNLPNFCGTLHISGTPLGGTLEFPMAEAARNVRRFLETGSALNRVDVAEYGALRAGD
jgi:D-3-phosphoglycerate dehydrogenase